MIVICSPLIILVAFLIAIAIKLKAYGPILYTQIRIGQHSKPFKLYKFRSMLVDVENQHSKARVIDKEDHRVTAIGKFIRKVRIDEIPQFWNVVRGDMSLIGPRPEQKGLVNLFNKELTFYSFRHKVRPGMTGLAQIKTSNATDLDATKMKLKYDLYYIKNTSFYLDIYILWRTLKLILSSLSF